MRIGFITGKSARNGLLSFPPFKTIRELHLPLAYLRDVGRRRTGRAERSVVVAAVSEGDQCSTCLVILRRTRFRVCETGPVVVVVVVMTLV